jgi:hypothetical protein
MLKTPVALCTLIDIVRCSKSRTIVTIVDVERCSHCSSVHVHREEDEAETSRVQEHREEDDVDRQRAIALDAP